MTAGSPACCDSFGGISVIMCGDFHAPELLAEDDRLVVLDRETVSWWSHIRATERIYVGVKCMCSPYVALQNQKGTLCSHVIPKQEGLSAVRRLPRRLWCGGNLAKQGNFRHEQCDTAWVGLEALPSGAALHLLIEPTSGQCSTMNRKAIQSYRDTNASPVEKLKNTKLHTMMWPFCRSRTFYWEQQTGTFRLALSLCRNGAELLQTTEMMLGSLSLLSYRDGIANRPLPMRISKAGKFYGDDTITLDRVEGSEVAEWPDPCHRKGISKLFNTGHQLAMQQWSPSLEREHSSQFHWNFHSRPWVS
ncbi:hypothetical protein EDD17DRAFT_1897177 [Pisolithus thermaeus]|nr:hypothetical protein EDD17DRAFT_1897177 [Pisolithus thermaeus]